MDNPEKYLLSKSKLRDLHYFLNEAKKEFEVTEGRWELIGKYHERLWFQKTWRKNQDELIVEYRELAHKMERIEGAIDEYKRAFLMHSQAVEFLHKTNMPFQNINLQQHELIQQQLF